MNMPMLMLRSARTAALACAAALCGPALAAAPLTGVACTAGVTGCAFALDDEFPSESQAWTDRTAYWVGFADSVTYTLGSAPLVVQGLTVSLDNNDSYAIERSLDGQSWLPLAFVGAGVGNVGWGMDTFSTLAGNTFFDSGVSFTPGAAAYLRITAVDGDTLNSVGELALVTTPVPEPSSWALLALGLGWLAARRGAFRPS